MQVSKNEFNVIFGSVLDSAGPEFYTYAQNLREEGCGLYTQAIEEWIGEHLVDYDDFEVDLMKPMINDIIDNVIYENNFYIIY